MASFSASRFWTKLRRTAQTAGRNLVYSLLLLYYAAQSPDVPGWAKTKAYGALAYFIWPVDVIPDVLPGGYTDDVGVAAAALAAIAMHITPAIQSQAKQKLRTWFGASADKATSV